MRLLNPIPLRPALLLGACLLALTGCAIPPAAKDEGAAKPAPLACYEASCCDKPASLDFAPFGLYCRFIAENAAGKAAEATATVQEAIAAARAETARTADAQAVLCFSLNAAAQRPHLSDIDSLGLYTDSLAACQAAYGEASNFSAQALHDAANQRLEMGQTHQVRPQLERVIELARLHKEAGLEAYATDALGRLAGLLGDSLGERRLLNQAVDMKQIVYGEASPEVASTYTRLGLSYMRTGERSAGREWYRRAIDILTEEIGGAHPRTMAVLTEYATSFSEDGDHKQAQEIFEGMLPQAIETYGPNDEQTVVLINNLGSALEGQKRYKQALARFDQALKIRRVTLPNSVRHGTAALNAAKTKRKISSCGGARTYANEALRVARALAAGTPAEPGVEEFIADAAVYAKACRMRSPLPPKAAKPAPPKR